jgi:hypothetical protein
MKYSKEDLVRELHQSLIKLDPYDLEDLFCNLTGVAVEYDEETEMYEVVD